MLDLVNEIEYKSLCEIGYKPLRTSKCTINMIMHSYVSNGSIKLFIKKMCRIRQRFPIKVFQQIRYIQKGTIPRVNVLIECYC